LQIAPPRGSDRWRQIEDLFHAAVAVDPGSRTRFLDEACASDAELRREVESLLAAVEESTAFVGSAIRGVAEAYLADQHGSRIKDGTFLDHYRTIRMLGAGGMGEVYLAQDVRLRRKVALKFLPPRLTRDAGALKRFENEAQLLSSLNHPNLLTVFEFCHAEGQDFLVTEFVEGRTVRQLLDAKEMDADTAVDIAIWCLSSRRWLQDSNRRSRLVFVWPWPAMRRARPSATC
jgi:eukaryotic-like serine/threonine-protein kinase